MRRTVSWLMVGWIACAGGFFTVVKPALAQATSQETVNERTRSALEIVTHEVDVLRGENLDRRVAVLEDTMVEVRWGVRTAAGVLLVQLVTTLLGDRRATSHKGAR